MNDEVASDLIRVMIMDIIQWVTIRPTEVSPLTPYQRALAELAAKYNVPSPYDTDPIVGTIPVPEGKIRNV